MATQDAPEYSHWLVIATIIFLVWAVMFAGVRVWGKVTRSMPWSLSDVVFGTSFAVGIGQCISIFVAVSKGQDGAGKDGSYVGYVSSTKTLFAAQILYTLSIGLSKCSTALFLGSLTRSTKQKMSGHVIAVICALWTTGCVLAIALRGDLAAPWRLVVGSELLYKRWLGIEASGLGLEVVIWAYSFTLVWGLNMRALKRLKVVGLFGFRFLLVPIVVGRLYFLNPSNNAGSGRATTLSYIFTEAAMQYSLISECMTCLKPFLQPFHTGWGLSTGSGVGYGSNPAKEVYTELSNLSRTGMETNPEKNGRVGQREVRSQVAEPADAALTLPSHRASQRRGRKEEMDGRFRFRPDLSGNYSSHVEAETMGSSRKRSDEDDIELLRRDDMVIHQTTTVSVVQEK